MVLSKLLSASNSTVQPTPHVHVYTVEWEQQGGVPKSQHVYVQDTGRTYTLEKFYSIKTDFKSFTQQTKTQLKLDFADNKLWKLNLAAKSCHTHVQSG